MTGLLEIKSKNTLSVANVNNNITLAGEFPERAEQTTERSGSAPYNTALR
jgi:hypothetical protein